jgi:hypothetical protein
MPTVLVVADDSGNGLAEIMVSPIVRPISWNIFALPLVSKDKLKTAVGDFNLDCSGVGFHVGKKTGFILWTYPNLYPNWAKSQWQMKIQKPRTERGF